MKKISLLVLLISGFAAAPAAAQLPLPGGNTGPSPQPYGTNDVGGFRNILPPGQLGTDNALQLAQFEANGTRPDHWQDQQGLYEDLLYASPHIKRADVDKYYKDATFGATDSDAASIEHPRNGVTIVRDRDFGVPHIYGATADDVEFGAGYAGAEDRLFLMDVLRHTGRGELSSFAGGSESNREMDRVQWGIAPYTEADLQRQIDLAPTVYGDKGRELVERGNAFVDGINAYIDAALLDPTKMPAEYAAFGTQPTHWTLRDVIAEASLIGGIFGKGGGNELGSAQLLQSLQTRYGKRGGRRAWSDFRTKNDPEAPTTVLHKRFPYETASAFSRKGLALPDPGSVKTAPVAPPVSQASSSAASARANIGAALLRAARKPAHASNWELVNAKHSKNGHAIGVLGPQVGYYDPQILLEEDLHGPGFDARGAAFPGVNLMVQLGHGRDFAWSATTATSDNIDTFAEVLCQDDFHYLYRGQCLPMDKLERTNSWTPSAGAQDGPGSETLTAYRTVHGIVFARGTVKGKKVAYVTARTTYMHEADSAIGFFCLNDPSCTHSPQSFRHAVDGINFGFNWAYIDSHHIAYQQSGWYPKRARGTSPDFPVLGTGRYDWQGYDTSLHTMKVMGVNERPHVVDQPYLVSWNNKQAPGWASADDKFDYGPVFRSQMIEARVKAGIRHGRKMTIQKLVQAMEEPASQDLRAWALMPLLRRVLGRPKDPHERAAIELLSNWARSGAHRRDLDRNGKDEDAAAITLMDAWWPRLVKAEFGTRRALGANAYSSLTSVRKPDDVLPSDLPEAPDYDDGWWSYVSKDLRDLVARRHVRGRWSRVYCGGGSRRRCRTALRSSLRSAIGVTPQELYGKGDCKSNPDPACSDQNRPTVASAIDMPPFPFQNRPTFQQTVEIRTGPPRAP